METGKTTLKILQRLVYHYIIIKSQERNLHFTCH